MAKEAIEKLLESPISETKIVSITHSGDKVRYMILKTPDGTLMMVKVADIYLNQIVELDLMVAA